MKVWRGPDGREFPLLESLPLVDYGAAVGTRRISGQSMRDLGYELVEKEPVGFEVEALSGPGNRGLVYIEDPRVIPGKKYKVTEVEDV